jgi:arabinose-5-phosphate isomerase
VALAAGLAYQACGLQQEEKHKVSRIEAIRSAVRTLETERDGLSALAEAIGNGLGEPFAEAIALISASQGRVIVTGMGKSGHVARKVAATLASTGTPAYYVHPAEASHGDLGMVQANDIVLAMSWSGETAELSDIIDYSRRFRVGLIAVTANAGSTLGLKADICLTLPRTTEACPNGLAPTTSTTMQMALGDALAVALLETRGFSPADFRIFHPGGKLGARLTFVRAVMHAGENLPLVAPGTSMAETILIMTAKGFGCVAVAADDGRLAGVVTDGDLRRHMGNGLLARRVSEVMNQAPKTVREDALVSEALEILNRNKITALFVVDAATRPVGIVHFHDLLRLGAA